MNVSKAFSNMAITFVRETVFAFKFSTRKRTRERFINNAVRIGVFESFSLAMNFVSRCFSGQLENEVEIVGVLKVSEPVFSI